MTKIKISQVKRHGTEEETIFTTDINRQMVNVLNVYQNDESK
jgi:hypothetical protein